MYGNDKVLVKIKKKSFFPPPFQKKAWKALQKAFSPIKKSFKNPPKENWNLFLPSLAFSRSRFARENILRFELLIAGTASRKSPVEDKPEMKS